ncbi:hypothetical protein ACUN24_20555 [Pedobacter sp. WC2501]|uniref:hypothetical protein n=1 Tax=Pedobacter sp. WC2501 TaxID=3461400 RepID=UPI00404573B0
MFGSNTIEIAIGLILVFMVVSTICTAIREGIEAKFKTRAAYLEQGLRQLLADPGGAGLASTLYGHPLISGLFNGPYTAGNNASLDLFARGGNLPSYIPAKNFARAMMDIAANGKDIALNNSESTPVLSLAEMRSNISNIGNPQVQRILLNAIDLAQGDIQVAQDNLESWFEGSMDRISGWYKRSTQWVIFWIGLSVAVLLNVNTITIVDYLSSNDTARKVLVEKASSVSADSASMKLSYELANRQLGELALPIGWKATDFSFEFPEMKGSTVAVAVLKSIFGWLITALAATLGAPFWFDLLNKFMVIRSTVKPNEKSGEEGSKDNKAATPTIILGTGPAPLPEAGGAIEEHGDCCGIQSGDDTPDEDLPASKGGVEP